jgi:hypothetical protein
MTIDRFPLWVATSLLGFAPNVEAQDEIPAPLPPPAATQPQSEEVTQFNRLPVFGWAMDRDLPMFDFAQAANVLGNKPTLKAEASKASRFSVAAESKPDAKKDREIQHYARLYRIWTFESFRHDAEEYRNRVTTANNMLRVWEYEGCDANKREDLKTWFHQAALANATGKPVPECHFLNKHLLDQIAQGIPFAVTGGNNAGIAFARAMIKGSVLWVQPQSMLATAMTTPLPFELPDPSLIVADEAPATEKSTVEPPVAELEIAPTTEPAATNEAESKPVQIENVVSPETTP